MKKCIVIILSLTLLICFFPISASAEEALKAPTVQYKIVNHDKVSLKWNKIDGAESYYIYMRNNETGKYIKKYEVNSNAVTLKKLSPDTEYSYAVVAVKDGVKSRSSNKVTFTTPSEWYYFREVGYPYFDLTKSKIYRQHFDGSGKEKFPVDFMLEPLEKYYSTNKFELALHCQYKGYVYLMVSIPSYSDSSEELYTASWRIKNDGSNAEYFSTVSDTYELYFDKKGNAYVCIRLMWEDNDTGDTMFAYNVWCNDKFIYSSNIEYLVVGNDCIFASEYSSNDSNRSKIVKINSDGSDVQTFLTEADNISIDPIFCDDNYLYYIKRIRSNIDSHRDEELCRVKLSDTNDIQSIYTFGALPIGFPAYEYELELINGYIYFHWDDVYYRMKADGTGLTKSDKPFEWKY